MGQASRNQYCIAYMTGMEFEKVWKSLKGDPGQQAAYLRMLQPSSLPAIFKQALTAPLLSSMLSAVLGELTAKEPASSLDLLTALSRVPRFDMTVMCLPSREKRELGTLWDAAAGAMSVENAAKLGAVRAAYRI